MLLAQDYLFIYMREFFHNKIDYNKIDYNKIIIVNSIIIIMFRSLKSTFTRNKNTILCTYFGGGALVGSGIVGYKAYNDTRTYSYEECLINTTLGISSGAYCGLLVMATLPITLPLGISIKILRYYDNEKLI